MSSLHALRRWVAVVAALVVASASAHAQIPSQPDLVANADNQTLKRLSVEELSRIDVTSVSRRVEPLTEAAAAVQVITQDDLRRAGVVYLVEALRLADAMYVGRFDGRTWIAQPRGLAINGANKMQVLLDGRSIYSPFYSGIFWDVQDYLVADIDRIEIIRGPGASLWGANAVNGVVNIITRPSGETRGLLVTAGGGTEDRFLSGVRYGAPIGTRAAYRAYGRFTYRDAQVLSTGASAEDVLRRGQGGFRLDWDRTTRQQITLQGDAYVGRLGLLNTPDTPVSGGNLLARWTQTTGAGSQLQVQAYYDRVARHVFEQFGETRDTYDLDIQHAFDVGSRQHVVWGGGYRVSSDTTQVSPTLSFDPVERTTQLVSVFAQDEIRLVPDRLFATIGTKLERNDYTGVEVQPTARLRVTTHPGGSAWAAVSRAVRMPTRFDSDLRFRIEGPEFFVVGSSDFESETLVAYEAGYRGTLGPRLTLDVSAYRNAYDHLRSQDVGVSPISTIVLGNSLEGHVSGIESAASIQALPGLQLHASHTWMTKTIRRKPGSQDISGGEGNDPTHLATFQAYATFTPSLAANLIARYVGELPNPRTPAYVETDVILNWTLTGGLEVAVVGQNLLHGSHPEFPQAGPVFEEFQRNFYVSLTVRRP